MSPIRVHAAVAGVLAAAGPTAKQWEPHDWTFQNPDVTANPYDVVATAAFVHAASKATVTTELFYAGGKTWTLRFTGTRPGKWTFTTASRARALDGRRGTIEVRPDLTGRGFVTGFGSKWGWSGSGEAFVPQLVMYKSPEHFHGKPELVDEDIKTFLVEHGFNGFHTQVYCRWFDLHVERATKLASPDANPDPRTFEALEMLIGKTHAAGGMVHIWVWGDESRAMTPIRLGGKNGPTDRRLQRYVAARLGPIPGWTMGYGFDLDEWTKQPDLRRWHVHMHRCLGWPHMLGGRSVGPNHYRPGVKFPQIWEGLDYSGYEQHRPTYAAYCAAIDARPRKPSFSEDRFRIRQAGYPQKDYTMEMTRRGLWHSTMAGGVANIWGRLDGRSSRLGSKPYARPEWIKTWSVFFRNRFLRDMARRSGLSDGTCLAAPDGCHYVFYRQDAGSIRMDLTGMKGSQPAVAVDCLRAYKQIDLGPLTAGVRIWKAPRVSDWAIAVGAFTPRPRR